MKVEFLTWVKKIDTHKRHKLHAFIYRVKNHHLYSGEKKMRKTYRDIISSIYSAALEAKLKVEPKRETVDTHSHGIIRCNLSYIQRVKLRVDLECG